ncbi:MAG: two-component system, NtrC family, response regulator AtoC [Blastocatellia bacterium]|jgi:DNA-binding NtrC family response regulator|nr:two-component system, NtrC family, response regulator AtoC [Blastocatellia bacterium]
MNEMMERILNALVIDDERSVRDFVCTVLEEDGWTVTRVASAEEAFELLTQADWPVVFCDVMLGGADGFAVLRRFKADLPDTKVVLMTGHGNAAGALDATSFGAYDYLLKPFGVEELQSLSATLRDQLTSRPHRLSVGALTPSSRSDIDLVGRSHAFIEVMKQVGRVAATNLPVFLTGESGTGKELVAATLHQRSGRADKTFVAVNCGAIPAELIESELFGHVKGSFTGADRDRRGLWEEADQGTVFLDEITETSLSFQVKLLRVLQEGEIRRVGSNQTQRVSARVIASSNRDVEAEVRAGRFREDLYYRLNAVSIVLPPLRERRDDIPPLAQTFADRVYSLSPAVRFASEAMEVLQKYPWPGNIRELENAVVRAAAMCNGLIRVQDLPERIRNFQKQADARKRAASEDSAAPQEWPGLGEIEGRYVARVLDHTRGNKQAAARVLGVDRKTLDRMIKRHNISFEKGSITKSNGFPSKLATQI